VRLQINGIPNREFASGINANVNAMARIGYLFLREGNWNGQQLIPESYIDMARLPQIGGYGLPEYDNCTAYNASDHYGLLWWNNADGTLTEVPRDTYWAWGRNESLIVIYPGLDVVAVRAGDALRSD
jgi:CubicO group peptidase (beta-lactamase class C family)